MTVSEAEEVLGINESNKCEGHKEYKYQICRELKENDSTLRLIFADFNGQNRLYFAVYMQDFEKVEYSQFNSEMSKKLEKKYGKYKFSANFRGNNTIYYWGENKNSSKKYNRDFNYWLYADRFQPSSYLIKKIGFDCLPCTYLEANLGVRDLSNLIAIVGLSDYKGKLALILNNKKVYTDYWEFVEMEEQHSKAEQTTKETDKAKF